MQVFVIPAGAIKMVVGAGSQSFSTVMKVGQRFLFTCTAACHINQATGAHNAVAATDGNMLVPANTPVLINGDFGNTLAVIQDTVGGNATLTPVQV